MHVFKTADPSSAQMLSDLWSETFRDAYHDVHAPADIDAYCTAHYSCVEAERVLASRDYHTTLAYAGDTATGLVVIHWDPCPFELDGPSAELKQIYIRASEYGAGLGRRLFSHTLDAMREHGAEWIWLAVSDRNHRAKAFYRKHGFEMKGAGPQFKVGKDVLTSSVLARRINH